MIQVKMTGRSIERIKRAVLVWPMMAMLAIATCMPSTARAQDEDSADSGPPNARFSGFSKPVKYDGGTSLSYMFIVVLSVVSLSSMFKDAKRTHLD